MERRIYILKKNENNNNEWIFDEINLTLEKVSPPAIKYQVFDPLNVKIWVETSKYHRKWLKVEIIDDNLQKMQQNQQNFFQTNAEDIIANDENQANLNMEITNDMTM